MAGVDLVTVNYRGIGPPLLDLISGRVEVIFTSIASTIEYIRSGKLRPLAVTSAQRTDLLPDVAVDWRICLGLRHGRLGGAHCAREYAAGNCRDSQQTR